MKKQFVCSLIKTFPVAVSSRKYARVSRDARLVAKKKIRKTCSNNIQLYFKQILPYSIVYSLKFQIKYLYKNQV